jgi:hypothetical protein
MLNQYEIQTFIAGKLPQVKHDLSQASLTVYQSMQVLTDYTKRMALEHNFKMVEKCMGLVETLYLKGNSLVRNAVENVFIYSFSSIMSRCNIVESGNATGVSPEGPSLDPNARKFIFRAFAPSIPQRLRPSSWRRL